MRAGRLVFVLAFASVAGCSLLAPSDEEALGGASQNPDDDASKRDGSRSESSTADGGCKGVLCGEACCAACNNSVCAGCRLNGTDCNDGDQCCSNTCSAGKCGVSVGCAPAGTVCTEASACCTGLTCGSDSFDASSVRSCQACRKVGLPCGGNGSCCSARCVSGICSPCASLEADCSDDSQCCSGDCNKGHCRIPP